MRKIIFILLLFPAVLYSQDNSWWSWWSQPTQKLLTLIANKDTVLIGGYLRIGTTADTANTTGTQEIFMSFPRGQFLYNGYTQVMSFDIKDYTGITTFRVRIWHQTTYPDMTNNKTYTCTATSEDLSARLVNGTNNITLATPLYVQEGDCYSLQYVGSGNCISEVFNSTNVGGSFRDTSRYSTSLITDTVGHAWYSETASWRHFPIKFYSSPAPQVVLLGNSMIDGNPFWQGGVSWYGSSFYDRVLKTSIGYKLAKYTGWTVVNMGIGGQTTYEILSRVSEAVAEKPAFIWLEAGLNNPEPYHSDSLLKNMRAMIDTCVKYNIPFGFNRIGNYNGKTNATNFMWDSVNTLIRPYVESNGGLWCDMREFMSLKSDSVGSPADNDWLLNPYYGKDAVHYNDTGKSVWLWKILRSMRGHVVIPNDTMTVHIDPPAFTFNYMSSTISVYDQFTLDSANIYTWITSSGTHTYNALSVKAVNGAYLKQYTFSWTTYVNTILGTNDTLFYTINGYGKSGTGSYSSYLVHVPYSLVPALTSDSSSAPIRIYASSQLAGGYEKWRAFNADTTSTTDIWATNATNTGWITVDFGVNKTVSMYTIIGRDGGLNVDFKTWKFYGSDNNVDWVALDSQTNVANWTSHEYRRYSFTPATHRYFKWDITVNQGGAYVETVQLRIYGY